MITWLFILLVQNSHCTGETVSAKAPLVKLDPPGYGYDFIKDENTLNPIFKLTYKLNNTIDSVTANDTTKYLLPDCFEGESPEFEEFWYEPIIESARDYFTVYSWQSIADTGKRSLSSSTRSSFSPIPDIMSNTDIKEIFSGKYLPKGVQSNDWISIQNEQRKSRSMTTSVRYLKHSYTVKSPIQCPLEDSFKEWINEIADYIKASNEEDARYLAQILVAEYGTHYLSRHGYGGRMVADAYLSSSYRFQANSSEEIKNNSRKLFYDKFNVVESVDKDASFTLYESNIKQFKSTCIGCSIATLGGTNSSLAWSILLAQLFKSKAVILRDQEPISSLLEHNDLKSIPTLTRRKIKEYIDDTCREYIKRNSFKGCFDRRSIKFGTNYATYQPNEDICDEDNTFGGTYASTLRCSNLACLSQFQPCKEINVLTNSLKCPTGYDSILAFQTEDLKGTSVNLTECRGSNADGLKSLLYFGGIYSADQSQYPNRPVINPVTGASSCPEYFSSQPLFDCLNNRICLSLDEKAVSNAVPFGGFISSCMPQSNQYCMVGYTKVRINTYNNCTLYYCVQLKSSFRPTLEKPPFSSKASSSELINKILRLKHKINQK